VPLCFFTITTTFSFSQVHHQIGQKYVKCIILLRIEAITFQQGWVVKRSSWFTNVANYNFQVASIVFDYFFKTVVVVFANYILPKSSQAVDYFSNSESLFATF
jgi:hypothetical protein